jgi:predicted DNA-binding antitoxin AbrB/MazE fold protein
VAISLLDWLIVKNSKANIIIVLLGALFVFLVIFISFNQVKSKNAINVGMTIIPQDSILKIDGKRVDASKTDIQLQLGQHDISVERAGFTKKTQSIDIKKGSKIEIILELDASQKVYSKVEQAEIEGASRRIEEYELSYNLKKEMDLTSYLPIVGRDSAGQDYIIDYTRSVTRKVKRGERYAITIEAETPLGRQSALNKIRGYSFDPSDFEIIFKESQDY